MGNQLTIRVNAEDDIAAVSRPKAARSRALAVAAVVSSQFLASVAIADHVQGHEVVNPIWIPEMVVGVVCGMAVGVIVGFAAGVVLTRMLSGLRRN